MRVLWIPTLLMLGLTAACASGGTGGASPPSVKAAAAPAPAPVAGYDWHFTPSDEAVYLAYGVAESDDLKLGLSCVASSGKVEMTAPAPTGTREIHLEAGTETKTFAAEGERSELHDGDFLTAETTSAQLVFQRFRQQGWIAQWLGDRRMVYAAHPGSEAGVEQFFARCG